MEWKRPIQHNSPQFDNLFLDLLEHANAHLSKRIEFKNSGTICGGHCVFGRRALHFVDFSIMKKHFWAFLVVFVSCSALIGLPGSWAWRRRRRRRYCYRQDCVYGNWYTVGGCSRTCGGGRQLYRRGIRTWSSCGGTACVNYYHSYRQKTLACNTQCCRVNCRWIWNAWGRCLGCGRSTQSRTVRILTYPLCGGTACPSKRSETRSCNTGM